MCRDEPAQLPQITLGKQERIYVHTAICRCPLAPKRATSKYHGSGSRAYAGETGSVNRERLCAGATSSDFNIERTRKRKYGPGLPRLCADEAYAKKGICRCTATEVVDIVSKNFQNTQRDRFFISENIFVDVIETVSHHSPNGNFRKMHVTASGQ